MFYVLASIVFLYHQWLRWDFEMLEKTTALQTVRKAMTHIYYGTENEELRLSLWAVQAGSSFSVPKSAVASFPHCF